MREKVCEKESVKDCVREKVCEKESVKECVRECVCLLQRSLGETE